MVQVNSELIQKIAELARLELTADEVQKEQISLAKILGHIDQLQEVNTDGIEPMYHGVDQTILLRPDQVIPLPENADGKPKILDSAPESLFDGFKVPPVL